MSEVGALDKCLDRFPESHSYDIHKVIVAGLIFLTFSFHI